MIPLGLLILGVLLIIVGVFTGTAYPPKPMLGAILIYAGFISIVFAVAVATENLFILITT